MEPSCCKSQVCATPVVVIDTLYKKEQSLNVTFGRVYAYYTDVKNEAVHVPERFIGLCFQGHLQTLGRMGNFAGQGNAY
jgi:hypothetical protein